MPPALPAAEQRPSCSELVPTPSPHSSDVPLKMPLPSV